MIRGYFVLRVTLIPILEEKINFARVNVVINLLRTTKQAESNLWLSILWVVCYSFSYLIEDLFFYPKSNSKIMARGILTKFSNGNWTNPIESLNLEMRRILLEVNNKPNKSWSHFYWAFSYRKLRKHALLPSESIIHQY